MTKILKIKISRRVVGERVYFTYPKEYDKDKIMVVAYEHVGSSVAVNARGGGYEFCIGVVKDLDVESFLVSTDITLITTLEAKILGNAWRPKTTTVEAKTLCNIIAKLRASALNISSVLTLKEQDAIDPKKAEVGIIESAQFDNIIDDAITKSMVKGEYNGA